MIKFGAIQNWLLIIIKMLHIIIVVIKNAKEEDILDILKIKKIKMKYINTNENFIITKSHNID